MSAPPTDPSQPPLDLPLDQSRQGPSQPGPDLPTGLRPREFARWVWRQLTSMRTALILLLLLAVAAVPGSLLPQRGVNPGTVRAFELRNPDLSRWLDRFSLFDVYAAPWFASVYLMLMVSLVGCLLPRIRHHWRASRAAPPAPPRHLVRMPVAQVWTTGVPAEDLLRVAESALRRRRYRVVRFPGALAAENGRLRETGNLLFHFSLIVLLLALALGSLYGYRGRVLVSEGEGFANTRTRYDEFFPGSRFRLADLPPFVLTLRAFTARFEENGSQRGAPRDFRADIEVVDGSGAQPQQRSIEVNRPLKVGGSKVFLTGQGYAPSFVVRDATGALVFDGPVKFLPRDGNYTSTGAIKVPDARPVQLGFTGFFLPTAVIDQRRGPVSAFPDAKNPTVFLTAYTGDLGLDTGVPQSVYTLDTRRMRQAQEGGRPLARALAVGDTMVVPGAGSITFTGLRRFAVLQVAADPGAPLALVGSVLALAGLLASLFVRRQRLWVRTTALDEGTRVEVAGLTRSEVTPGLVDSVAGVVSALRSVSGPAVENPSIAQRSGQVS